MANKKINNKYEKIYTRKFITVASLVGALFAGAILYSNIQKDVPKEKQVQTEYVAPNQMFMGWDSNGKHDALSQNNYQVNERDFNYETLDSLIENSKKYLPKKRININLNQFFNLSLRNP